MGTNSMRLDLKGPHPSHAHRLSCPHSSATPALRHAAKYQGPDPSRRICICLPSINQLRLKNRSRVIVCLRGEDVRCEETWHVMGSGWNKKSIWQVSSALFFVRVVGEWGMREAVGEKTDLEGSIRGWSVCTSADMCNCHHGSWVMKLAMPAPCLNRRDQRTSLMSAWIDKWRSTLHKPCYISKQSLLEGCFLPSQLFSWAHWY